MTSMTKNKVNMKDTERWGKRKQAEGKKSNCWDKQEDTFPEAEGVRWGRGKFNLTMVWPKVQMSLCLANHLAKENGGGEVQLHAFLTSALDRGEWSASRSGRFTPGERASVTHWIGGWVDPRAGLDDVERINLLLEMEPKFRGYKTRSIVATVTELTRLTVMAQFKG
jgi:hypothetical protein